jgi:DNA-binding NarL/FixJ family response regulator
MQSSNVIKVLLVVPEVIQRIGLTHIITEHAGMEVCGEAATLDLARKFLSKKAVDLVIVSVRMENGGGYNLLKELSARKQKAWTVAYAYFDQLHTVIRAKECGATAVLSKEDVIPSIVAALADAAVGKDHISPFGALSLSREVLELKAARVSGADLKQILSARQQQIYELLGQDLQQKEIAAELGISDKTVNTNIARIREKLGFTTLRDVVKDAVKKLNGKKHESEG